MKKTDSYARITRLTLCILLLTPLIGLHAAEHHPNIVFILADDIGYGDLGCYGATRVNTPHVDRLAREGIRFTNAHATAAVCTPTRYSFITGQYAWRNPAGAAILSGEAPLSSIPASPPRPHCSVKPATPLASWANGTSAWAGETSISTVRSSLGRWSLVSTMLSSSPPRATAYRVYSSKITTWSNLDPSDPITISYSHKSATSLPVASTPNCSS